MLDECSVTAKLSFSCLPELFEYYAKRTPDAPAILAPGRVPLTYGRLYRHIDEIGRSLRIMGIGCHDRVAVVMPNGPELVAAIACVASYAACAVINPAYAIEELERYFADLQPKALITQAEIDSPMRRLAISRGMHVIELSTTPDVEAGLFTLIAYPPGKPSHEPVGPGSTAVLLLTSGTTSRPKIVPLTHANICASAYSMVSALSLTVTDRCLNVLPLFHGHGLFATIFASLSAGASVVCTPGCDINKFFTWLSDFRPTWYSAVPTMHQAILAQARQNGERVDCRLRLIRSASAPLPPPVLAELERTFQTTVIEFYGMTETTSAPIACNPMPPRQRKAGSVGIPVELDVAIMDEAGTPMPRGQTGQVAVRGASVMPGYDGDPIATQAAFAGDWFKTGDQGFFDEDGYLFLSGRTREMINRGGEKIAPREVDEALLEHPAIAEAVTFAVPHTTLGEDIMAAIVLRPDAKAMPKEIRQFVSERLADFKVPRQVLVVKALPKGPTGKIQRVGMAAKLGLAAGIATPQSFVSPRTPLENVLAGIWAEILQRDRVGIDDDFFALGGDSLLASHVLTRIYDIMHLKVDVAGLFDAPTVAEMAQHLETLILSGQARQPTSDIVRVPRGGEVPASAAQERVCKLQHALPDLPFFNVLYALRVTSPVDVTVLKRSIDELVRRHEILRTTFAVVDGRHVQVIASNLTVPLVFDDLRKFSSSKKESVAHRLVQEELVHSFDLTRGPLFRARLIRQAETEHLLLVTTHQTIVDGWSLGVFGDELATLYEAFAAGKASPLAPLAIQYADYAVWQRQWRSHPDVAAQLAYWRAQLCRPLPMIRLGTKQPRWAADPFRTAQREVALPERLTEAVKQFSHREGGTLFMALVAALKTLLNRYVGEEDLRVATNVANRNRPGTEGLIGPLANTVILRSDFGGDPTHREVMRRVRAATLAAYANQDLPFEELAETLAYEHAIKPGELAQVMILLHNAALRPVASSSKALAFEEADPDMLMPLVTTTTYDIILVLREGAHGLVGSCIYKPHLFGAKFIDRLLRDFRKVLETMVTRPERPISTIRVSLKSKR